METTANVINVKFGTIEENNQDWAQVNIIDDKLTVNDGFYGVQPAKLRMDTSDRNMLAQKLVTELRKAGKKMPCLIKLQLDSQLVGGEMKMIVVGYSLV
ncbi:hypothetical protein FR271_21965 [Vibrio vulnificus]|nr:hypothetical protein [Vibrio vulnificus]EGR0093618.1 hypothetical protein [Vibrio vulnificus]EIJ0948491.1 hypothetical protein [Vibrio vulnificus]